MTRFLPLACAIGLCLRSCPTDAHAAPPPAASAPADRADTTDAQPVAPALGEMGETCRARSDCQAGLKCVDSQCRDPLQGAACQTRQDCGGGQLGCYQNVCTSPADASKANAAAAEEVKRDPPERKAERAERDEKQRDSARAMVISGAVLSAVGWLTFIGGSSALIWGIVNNDTSADNAVIYGGVIMGVSAPIGIAGSVVLGLGMRKMERVDDRDQATRRDSWMPAPALGVGPVTLTVEF